ARTYGSLDDRAFVTQLYANVLHRQPDSGGLAFHVNNLAGGMSRAQTLVGFSESPENQAALIGVMQGGMEYVPSASEFRLADGMFGTRLAGTAQNDLLRGGAGNDYIDGGQGIDTLMLEGPRASYQTTVSGNTTVLKHLSGSGGADTLISVERLRFADVSVALDVSGTGGQAYRLYQAAFNRAPDASGFGVQMNALDSGWSLVSIAQNFIDSPEFARTYGSLDDRAFVTRLYANVLHRQPDSGGLEFHINNLAGGMSRAQTLVGFSESPENQAALIGVIQGGMEYVPVA
ncbi:MAG TPA: DUF4214 domain-containing protein, partial [Noviherbaspirillum sp.]|nr:DUF4214 domain-containing protein [Noviherbaspirillum sp.]